MCIRDRGEIGALVYATGTGTYFGKTAELVADAHTVSHFQRAVLKIGNYLIILAVALVTLIVVTAILRGDAILTTLQFALVLTVAEMCIRDRRWPRGSSVWRAVTASSTEANRWSSPTSPSSPLRPRLPRTVLLVLAIAKATPLESSWSSNCRSARAPV